MSVAIDVPVLDSIANEAGHRARLTETSMRAAFMMRDYVPVDETYLRNSEPMSSIYPEGLLIWNTPYAHKHYVVPMNHSDPNTCDHWDEAMVRNDMPKLLDYVARMYEEDM